MPPSREGELLVAPPLRGIRRSSGEILITAKFAHGMMAYARQWPGPVTALLELDSALGDQLDYVPAPADGSFRVEAMPPPAERRARLRQAGLILGRLDRGGLELQRAAGPDGPPYVHVVEWDAATRRQIIGMEAPDFLRRIKRVARTVLEEKAFRTGARDAAGLQCCGVPAYRAYGRLNPRAIQYFDTRATAALLVRPDVLAQRLERLRSGGPLRLVFSGRFVAIKGVDHLPRVAQMLAQMNVPFELDLVGDGVLRDALVGEIQARGLAACVHVKDALDYETELVPYLSTHADLFVCCHRQADPSCTYLETLSCGVPIIGYDNAALASLVALSAAGWATPMDRPAALARAIADLAAQRSALVRAAQAAREFASQHTFERVIDQRMAHLHGCLRHAPDARRRAALGHSTVGA